MDALSHLAPTEWAPLTSLHVSFLHVCLAYFHPLISIVSEPGGERDAARRRVALLPVGSHLFRTYTSRRKRDFLISCPALAAATLGPRVRHICCLFGLAFHPSTASVCRVLVWRPSGRIEWWTARRTPGVIDLQDPCAAGRTAAPGFAACPAVCQGQRCGPQPRQLVKLNARVWVESLLLHAKTRKETTTESKMTVAQ